MTGPSMGAWLLTLSCCLGPAILIAADPTPLALELSTLAERGLAGTPEGLKAAERAYARAVKLAPDDGRVEYAWSLVLTKHRKFAEADEHLQKALAADPPCLPAHVADVRTMLRLRKYTDASERLIDIAEIVGSSQRPDLGEEERRSAARWLGQAMGYLTGPLDDPDLAASLNRREPGLVAHLGKFEPDYRQGRNDLGSEHRRLQDEMARLIDEAEGRKTDALREEADKLDKIESQYKSASAESADAQKLVRERVADLDAKLSTLEKQYNSLARVEETLTTTILGIQQSLVLLQAELDQIRRWHEDNDNRSPPFIFARKEFALNQKGALLNVELELARANMVMAQQDKQRVVQAATSFMQQRAAGASAQERISGNSARLSSNLQRWQKTIQDQTKKIAETPAEKMGRLPALRTRMQSWTTYDKTTPEQELAFLTTP